jgi:cytoskeleton protein RodZ
MTETSRQVAQPPAEAPLAGADLRAARERLGVDIAEASRVLRLRAPYLVALEEGRLSALPAPAYALGYLRTYAAALGLDPDETSRRFRAEAEEIGQKTELAFPAPMPERGLPAGAIMLMGVVLLGAVYAGWYRLSGEGRLPAETIALIPERLAPLAEQAVPPVLMARPQPAPPMPGAPAETVVAVSNEPVVNAPAISPSSAAAAPVAAIAARTAAAADPTGEQSRVVIRATTDAWLQVKDRAGTVLLNRVLKPGEIWPVGYMKCVFL